jgi:hypothetical protein
MQLSELPCMFCMSPDGAAILFDRRSRPYTKCLCCGARSFLPSAHCLTGFALVLPVVRRMIEQMQGDATIAAESRAQARSFVEQLRVQLAPAPASIARPTADQTTSPPLARSA